MLTLSGAGQPQNGGGVEERFIITVKTDNAGGSADNQFTVPTRFGGYDYTIDTSDGQTINNLTGNYTITFPTPGTYDILISGDFPWYRGRYSADKDKLIEVKNWGIIAWENFDGAFAGCNNLTVISATDVPDLSNVINLSAMFYSNNILEINNIENWDVSNVQLFSGMFYQNEVIRNPNIPIDLSGWDMSSATNISLMFHTIQQPTTLTFDLSNWDISNITNMTDLFRSGGFDTVKKYDDTLLSWEAQNPQSNIVTNFGDSQYTYEVAAARQTLIDTYGWTITDGGQVASPEFALKWETTTPNEEIQIGVGSGTFNYDIDWGDGTVETYTTDANVSHTYAAAGNHITKITGDFPHLNMKNLTDDVYREKLRDVLNWGSIVWQDWTNMFRDCNGFTGLTATDLPNLLNVTSFSSLGTLSNFGNHYNSTVQNWNVSSVTNMSSFSYYGSWRNKISTWDTSNVTNFSNFLRSNGAFDNGADLADMDNFDVSSAIDMSFMFNRTNKMANIYIGSWDVSSVTDMRVMFNPLVMSNSGIENWDVSNASNFNQFNAYGQTDISLANWTPVSMTTASSFMLNNNTMSVANYDATLISWAAQSLQSNVSINFGNTQYTLGGAAEAARNTLINTYGWTITDGGGIFVGLLDTYTGAAAAYSLRDLASASLGSAVVRVRRSSDNTEQDFTATEITDGTLTTFTGAGDGFVTTWYDQSSNSNNLIQNSALMQLLIVTSGGLILNNGLPSMETNGLSSCSFGTLPNNQLTFTHESEATWSIVYNFTSFGIISRSTGNIGTASLGLQLRQGPTPKIANGSGVNYSIDYAVGPNIINQTVHFLWDYDLSILNMSQKTSMMENQTVVQEGNASVGSGAIGSSTSPLSFNGIADGRFGSTGKYQEWIIWDSRLDSDRVGIQSNINTYYGIYTPSPPSSGLLADYPGASAAYSLRNLGNTTTNVVRVRRSSDNTEQDFTAAEITDGTLTTFTGANDGFVTTWYDQSGNMNNAVQTSANDQPKIVISGVVELDNGKPCLRYDTTGNDSFNLTTRLTNVRSTFSVVNFVYNSGDLSQYSFGDSSNYDYASGNNTILNSAYASSFVRLGDNKINNISSDFVTTTRPLVQSLVSMIHTSSQGAISQISKDRNLSGRSLQGKLQEIIIYPSDQSLNRTGIETNINNEYTIY